MDVEQGFVGAFVPAAEWELDVPVLFVIDVQIAVGIEVARQFCDTVVGTEKAGIEVDLTPG